MPRDSKGGFHMGGLRPLGKDSKLPMSAPKLKPMGEPKMGGGTEGGEGEHSELHAHGDGSYHTIHGGKEEQHPDLGHALTHLGHANEGGKHMHVHHDGGAMHTHAIDENGQHGETEMHDTPEEAGEAVTRGMGGESMDDGREQEMAEGAPDHGGLSGFQG